MKTPVFVAIGILAALLIGCMPASAASSGEVTAYSNGNPSTADFVLTVENVGMFTLEDAYLNFSVESNPRVLYSGTNATIYLHVSIDDGSTNYTWNKTIAAKNDRTVYSNVSMATPSGTFVVNSTATLKVEVNTIVGGDFDDRDYETAEIGIFAEPIGGAVLNLIPVILVVAIVSMMLPMIAKFGKRK